MLSFLRSGQSGTATRPGSAERRRPRRTGLDDDRIVEVFELPKGGVAGIRRRFCKRGLEGTVKCKSPDQEYERKLEREKKQSVMARQALSRRIPAREAIKRRTTAWQRQRNATDATVDWQFRTEDARVELKRLYP